MSKKSSGAFDRKLAAVIIKRLRQGENAEILVAQLQARLTPEQARAVVDDATWRLAAPRRNGRAPTILLVVCVVLLAMQQWALTLGGLKLAVDSPEFVNPSGKLIAAIAATKLALLIAGLVAQVWRRNAYVTAGYGLVILYAYPISQLVEPLIMPNWRPGAGLQALFSLYAALSFAAVAALAALWRLNHRPKPDQQDPVAPET